MSNNPPDTNAMRRSCRAAAAVMAETAKAVRIGASTHDIDRAAARAMSSMGVRSAFLGYSGYPFSTCVSLNDEVLHGMASPRRLVAGGDVVKVDLGVVLDGHCSDLAQTFVMDDGSLSASEGRRLSNAVLSALMAGIYAARVGNTVLAITMAIESSLKSLRLRPVSEMTGHGVGKRLHELPPIPNAVVKRQTFMGGGEVPLKAGMTLAIEPMAGLGRPDVMVMDDGWTIVMKDGKPAAHWEHTILVTEDEAEILTRMP